jgi:mono/diheme cytochrome c family protein
LLLFVLAAVGLASLVVLFRLVSGGIQATGSPGALETTVARRLRAFAIPSDARRLDNPVAVTPAVLNDAMAHFADHCAACHGNDGSGDTEMGRGLYPKPLDMRDPATQTLTDGELFYIIENGVKLTGMPAWGTGTTEGQTASWALVHFIRHLPKLTDEELNAMAAMNPRSPAEWRMEEDIRRFLEGETDAPPPPAAAPHTH